VALNPVSSHRRCQTPLSSGMPFSARRGATTHHQVPGKALPCRQSGWSGPVRAPPGFVDRPAPRSTARGNLHARTGSAFASDRASPLLPVLLPRRRTLPLRRKPRRAAWRLGTLEIRPHGAGRKHRQGSHDCRRAHSTHAEAANKRGYGICTRHVWRAWAWHTCLLTCIQHIGRRVACVQPRRLLHS
jgi:hypothetical protein